MRVASGPRHAVLRPHLYRCKWTVADRRRLRGDFDSPCGDGGAAAAVRAPGSETSLRRPVPALRR